VSTTEVGWGVVVGEERAEGGGVGRMWGAAERGGGGG